MAATAAEIIDRTSRDRSLREGVLPSPATTTRYTAATTQVRPARETVWASIRSIRPARRRVLHRAMANANGTSETVRTNGARVGQSNRTRRASVTSSTTRAMAAAQPNHCMRWRSSPVERA